MTMKTLSRITAILFQLGTKKVRRLAITVFLSRVIIFLLSMLTVRQLDMPMTTLFRITDILFQLEQIRSGDWS